MSLSVNPALAYPAHSVSSAKGVPEGNDSLALHYGGHSTGMRSHRLQKDVTSRVSSSGSRLLSEKDLLLGLEWRVVRIPATTVYRDKAEQLAALTVTV